VSRVRKKRSGDDPRTGFTNEGAGLGTVALGCWVALPVTQCQDGRGKASRAVFVARAALTRSRVGKHTARAVTSVELRVGVT
jgi:hypothetical protein